MAAKASGKGRSRRRFRFTKAAALVERTVRDAGEGRGFAVARVLTHWDDVAGPEIARIARPVKVSYGRSGLGATLTVLTTGPHAPMLAMQKEALRARINACYGYAAISRVAITQTASTGFSEGQAVFTPAPKKSRAPDPGIVREAASTAADIEDAGLRSALELLGRNVLSARRRKERPCR